MRGIPRTRCGAASAAGSGASPGLAPASAPNSSAPLHFGHEPIRRSPSTMAGVFQRNSQLVQRTAKSSLIAEGIGGVEDELDSSVRPLTAPGAQARAQSDDH